MPTTAGAIVYCGNDWHNIPTAPYAGGEADNVRFGLSVDHDNGHHVHFRVFAATGGQHLGLSGTLVMTSVEYAVFRELLGPKLTGRAERATPDDGPDPSGGVG